jgi:hypothetical protein
MRKTFFTHFFIWCLALGFAFTAVAQDQESNAGKIPDNIKADVNFWYSTDGTDSETAYGWISIAGSFVSFPVPEGTPFTTIAPMTAPGFLSSACFGSDGTLYFTDTTTGELYTVNTATGALTLVGSTGVGLNGITYDWSTGIFYGATATDLYTVNVATGGTTYVGSFGVSGGLMIDIAAACDGSMYGYDLGVDNFYSINSGTGLATLIGPLGFNANYGQGMSFDYITGTLYLSAFDGTGTTGQLREVNLATGGSTILFDWGFEQMAPFAINNGCGAPCPVGQATNPNPANGATDVPVSTSQISWVNGAGATSIEVFFNGSSVYSGAPLTSYSLPALTYGTTYSWKVNGSDGTCTTYGVNWSFTVESNPMEEIDTVKVYPQSVAYWTGTTDGTNKTDNSEVRGLNTEDGWFMFDITSIADAVEILQVTLNGYVNSTNWPYWSATPLPGLNPLTATAAELKAAAEANSADGTAYVYSNESSSFTTGQYSYLTESWTNTDLFAAVTQGWFAMGMDSRDNSTSYWINWDGWNQTNVPFLEVIYVRIVPVELTSFAANVNDGNVTLNWSTATETNNQGFEIQRSSNGTEFAKIGYVAGHGTVTEIMNYAFTDSRLDAGSYSYRLKQVDFDGSFEYSNVVEVEVGSPATFSLDQNYPNPFNPSTVIEFNLAVDSRVSLTVFDVLGQEVATLISGNLAAGSRQVTFDASALNSGVFFYRIDATGVDGTNFSSVKKMILTK